MKHEDVPVFCTAHHLRSFLHEKAPDIGCNSSLRQSQLMLQAGLQYRSPAGSAPHRERAGCLMHGQDVCRGDGRSPSPGNAFGRLFADIGEVCAAKFFPAALEKHLQLRPPGQCLSSRTAESKSPSQRSLPRHPGRRLCDAGRPDTGDGLRK